MTDHSKSRPLTFPMDCGVKTFADCDNVVYCFSSKHGGVAACDVNKPFAWIYGEPELCYDLIKSDKCPRGYANPFKKE